MSCTPLPKAAKPFWANQLTRLLVAYVKLRLYLGKCSRLTTPLSSQDFVKACHKGQFSPKLGQPLIMTRKQSYYNNK